MSRSFLVDSLILKKPHQPESRRSPASQHELSDPRAATHALHTLARPGGSILDSCCPWCVHGGSAEHHSLGLHGFLPHVSLPSTMSVVKPLPTSGSGGLVSVAPIGPTPGIGLSHQPRLPSLPSYHAGLAGFHHHAATTAPPPPPPTATQHHPLRALDPRRIRYMNLPGKSHPSH